MQAAPDRISGFRLLTFDTFGTLIDWETGIWNALAPLRRRLPQPREREAVLRDHAEWESRLQAAEPGLPYRQLLTAVHRRLAERWQVAPDAAESAAYGASVPDWPAFADAPDALAYLRRRFRIATLTNCDRQSYRGASRRLGDPWHAIWTAEDVGVYKPDPRSFAWLLARAKAEFGAGPEEILHVAQSLHHDIEPAPRCGLPYTAWIDRRHDRPGDGATPPVDAALRPTFRFTSLKGLVDRHRAETA